MALRDDLARRMEKKREEIFSLEMQIREARSYLQALEDMSRLLPRDTPGEAQSEAVLRPHSTIAKAREVILAAGGPLHIQDILAAVGKPATKEARAALSGSLSAYVRRREIFTRPGPNTFGLLEQGKVEAQAVANGNRVPEPPPGFGEDEGDTADEASAKTA